MIFQKNLSACRSEFQCVIFLKVCYDVYFTYFKILMLLGLLFYMQLMLIFEAEYYNTVLQAGNMAGKTPVGRVWFVRR